MGARRSRQVAGRLDAALHWPGPAHGEAPNLAQDEIAVIQLSTVAILLVGEGVVAVRPWKRGKPGFSPLARRRKNAWDVLSSRASTSCKTCAWIAAYSGKSARRSFSSASCW